jgi:hypothetical protein
VADLSYDKLLWDLALLYDISHHFNDLNAKLLCQQTHINEFLMFWAVRDLKMKLKLFQKQFANINLCHFFFSCDLFHKDKSVCVPFLNVHGVDIINSLEAMNFKMGFNDSHSHAASTCIF